MEPLVVTHNEWLKARKALLAEEREATHLRDRINRTRRALPWERVEKPYVFASPDGPRTLADLFQGRGQLLVQHFMLPPGEIGICKGCAGIADHVDAARRHFENADLSFAAVSRAPIAKIEAARRRMGWTFQWVSCGDNGFNHDFGTAFTPEEIGRGETAYNYGTTPYAAEDLPGVSVFVRTRAGELFHSYSAYSRGTEQLFTPFNFLDLVPKGRNETDGTMSWVRLHDEYGTPAAAKPHCHDAD